MESLWIIIMKARIALSVAFKTSAPLYTEEGKRPLLAIKSFECNRVLSFLSWNNITTRGIQHTVKLYKEV